MKSLLKNTDGYTFKVDGYDCFICFSPLGCINGYVAVAKDHPAYEKDYSELNYSVHGGLTYSNFGICGWFKKKWVLGFDTAHAGDWRPNIFDVLERKENINIQEEYKKLFSKVLEYPAFKDIFTNPSCGSVRDEVYVKNEIKQLVKQLKEDDEKNQYRFKA